MCEKQQNCSSVISHVGKKCLFKRYPTICNDLFEISVLELSTNKQAVKIMYSNGNTGWYHVSEFDSNYEYFDVLGYLDEKSDDLDWWCTCEDYECSGKGDQENCCSCTDKDLKVSYYDSGGCDCGNCCSREKYKINSDLTSSETVSNMFVEIENKNGGNK